MQGLDQEIITLRRQVLQGDYSICRSLRIPQWKLLVFVSSSPTDNHDERDELLNILKDLSRKGNEHGVAVNISEIRWGAPGEACSEHGTWQACKTELERCRDQSSGIYFLSLQSEKYAKLHLMYIFILSLLLCLN